MCKFSKARMETYESFDEKDKYFKFGGKKIDSIENFNHYTELLIKQYSTKDFVFRGVSEAKFKLYNSAQRNWSDIADKEKYLDELEYDNFIVNLMTECKKWNYGTIPNLLKTYNIKENNSIAYLSFMRHFEIPTPLLDFSKNPNKALYFATEDIPENFIESENDMENYFSIYSTYQNNTAYEIFRSVFDKNRTNRNYGEFDYNDLTKNSMALISESDKEFCILNNIRIANQEGLFFYNNSPNLSIEEQYKTFADMLLEKVGNSKFHEILAHETFSSCLNFHKKFANKIKTILTEQGITRGFIYPEISNLKEHIKICT